MRTSLDAESHGMNLPANSLAAIPGLVQASNSLAYPFQQCGLAISGRL